MTDDACGDYDEWHTTQNEEPPRNDAEGQEFRQRNPPNAMNDPEEDQVIEPRYPRRIRQPPPYLGEYVTKCDDQSMMAIDYCYRVSAFLQTYEEAMNAPEAPQWTKAMDEEIRSLKENDTFTLTELPKGRSLVGGKWVYTIKEGQNENKTYKARYDARGYSQVKGIDYTKTFAPTARMTSVRAAMQLAAQNGIILHQMDVKTAYLNANIDCEIYMEQPKEYEEKGANGETYVYKLRKSIYGLKQSGRNWNKMLQEHLLQNDLNKAVLILVCLSSKRMT